MARRPTPPAAARHDIEDIIAAVTARTGVGIDEIIERGSCGDRFRPRVRIARAALYWLAYRANGGTMTYAAIGARLGRSWHTVRHGVDVMGAERDRDPALRRMTDDLRSALADASEPNRQQPPRSPP